MPELEKEIKTDFTELLALIERTADGKEWRYTQMQIMKDGRVIIHLKVEKTLPKIAK